MAAAAGLLRVVAPGEVPVDPTDLDAVFRRFGPEVLRRATRLVGRRDEADDLLQDVFVAYARYRHDIADLEHARVWLHLVVAQRARRLLRKRGLLRLVGLDQGGSDVAASEASPEQRMQVRQLYEALDRLPSGPRLAWLLRHGENEPLASIALACNCSLATVKRWIARAEQHIEETSRG